MKKEIKNRVMCKMSPLYGKDNNKTLHFYCDYCWKEMDYGENRECEAKNKTLIAKGRLLKLNANKTMKDELKLQEEGTATADETPETPEEEKPEEEKLEEEKPEL